MSYEGPPLVVPQRDDAARALEWLARILTNFAKAEQAIGKLCFAMNLPIKNGLLEKLNEAINRLNATDERRCQNLAKRIVDWQSRKPERHLLAHATVRVVYDENYEPLVVTRHLPLEKGDVTPDRIWTESERSELLRLVTSDGRSIADQVQNILNEPVIVARLRKS